jgi:hypothetical protein
MLGCTALSLEYFIRSEGSRQFSGVKKVLGWCELTFWRKLAADLKCDALVFDTDNWHHQFQFTYDFRVINFLGLHNRIPSDGVLDFLTLIPVSVDCRCD